MKIYSKKPSIVVIDGLEHNRKISGQYYYFDYIEREETLLQNKIMYFGNVIKEYNGGPMGFQLHTYDYCEQGIAVLRTKDMCEMSIKLEEPIFISKEKHDELKNSKTYPGDIVISKTGQIGVCSLVPQTIGEVNLNQALCNIRVDESLIDKYFLVTFFNTKYGYYQFIREGQGKSVQDGLTRDEIYSLKIIDTSKEIQTYIGNKVRKADELRELAGKFKKEAEYILEKELQLINLGSGLEDIKDKYGWQNQVVLAKRIDSDYYSKKHLVAEEFLLKCKQKSVSLKELVEVIYSGKKPCEEAQGEEVFFIQSGNISSNFIELDQKIKVEKRNYKLTEYQDLLFAKDGETIGKVAVNYSYDNAIINEHTYCVRLKKKYKHYAAYIYYLLTNKFVNNLLKREATGSAQKGLNQDFIDELTIPIIQEESVLRLKELEENRCKNIYFAKRLIQEAKQDIEDLIEGNFNKVGFIQTTSGSR